MDAGSEVAQVLVQLGSLNDGLHSIRRALDDGIGQLTTSADEPPEAQALVARVVEELQSLNNGMNSIGTVLSGGIDQMARAPSESSQLSSEALQALVKQLQTSRTSDPMSSDTRRIIVQYRLPKEVVRVLNEQFKLMQGWMIPVLNASNLQSSDIQQLQRSLDATLNSYATLVEHLEEPPRPPS